MEKKRSAGVTIFGVIMLIYSLWFLGGYLFNYRKLLLSSTLSLISMPNDFLDSGLFLKLLPLFVGLPYLIFSINILRLENWARVLAVYFSGLIGLIIIGILIQGWVGQLKGEYMAFDISILVTISLLPALIFLFFFTRAKVKEQFK